MLEILIGLAWKIPVIALAVVFIEWAIHRYTMHRKVWGLGWSYRWHHEEHHAQKMNEIHNHVDILWQPYVVAWLVGAAWGGSRIYFFNGLGGASGIVSLGVVLFIHRYLWNHIHRNIHELDGYTNWTRYIPLYYGWVKRHHLEHHRHPNYNLSILFPLVDTVMKTQWRRS